MLRAVDADEIPPLYTANPLKNSEAKHVFKPCSRKFPCFRYDVPESAPAMPDQDALQYAVASDYEFIFGR